MKKIYCVKPIFILVLALIFCTIYIFPQDNISHRVEKGDTLRRLAEKYLGDSKFWQHLVIFNDLPTNIGADEQPALGIMLIPGKIFSNALEQLEKARGVREQALAAKAPLFAKEDFRKAEKSFNNAERAFNNAKYAQAEGLAAIGEKDFAKSIAIADRNAVVSLMVNLNGIYGEVKLQSRTDRKWREVSKNIRMIPGDRIRTGEKSGVLLVFRDRSILKVRAQSEVILKTYSNDQRTDKTVVEADLETGDIDGFVKPFPVDDSTFTLRGREISFAFEGVKFHITNNVITGEVGISVFDGQVIITVKGGDPFPLRSNKGVVITKEGKVNPLPALLASPKLKAPKNNGISFNQRPEIEWYKAHGIVKFRVEVSDDVDFAHLIDDAYTNRLGVTTSILDVGRYFWRVSSVDANGLVGPPGNSWTFFIKRNLELAIKPSDSLLEKAGIPYANINHQFTIMPAQPENSVDWIEVSVDGGTFKRLEGPIRFIREGMHSIKYRAVDVRNERQKLYEYKVSIDDTRPFVQIGADKAIYREGDDKYAPLNRVYMGVAKDELSGIRNVLVKVDNGEFRDFTPDVLRDKGKNRVISKKLRFTTDGLHSIIIKAQDLSGNWSDINELKIFVDRTAPQVKIRPSDIVIQGKETIYVSGKCKFFFDVNDDISGTSYVTVSIDGSEFVKVEDSIPHLPGGKHVIQYKTADNVGNVSNMHAYRFEVDNIAPQTKWETTPRLFQARRKYYGPKGLKLKFFAVDNLSGIQNISVDVNDEMLPGVIQLKDGSMKFSKEGTYRISYFSIDRVKNSEESKEIVFIVDATPPDVDVSIEGPRHEAADKLYVSARTTIHMKAKDDISGVNRVEISENGRPFMIYKGPIRGLQQGAFQLTYKAIDNVDNVSDKKDIRITVDNTSPEVWVQKRGHSYVIQALDDLSGVHEIYAKVDGGELKRYEDQSVLPEGKAVLFWVVDNVGNESAKKEDALD